MTSNLQIKFLADVPQHAATLAQWTIDAWGQYDPTLNLQAAIAGMQDKLNKDKIPLAFVAFIDNQPVGMVTLKDKIKPKGYEDRDLWLGSHWVIDEYRNQGVGAALLEHACAKAREFGYKKISVWDSNPENPGWYKQHGWKEFAKDTYQNHPIVFLEYDL
jgi:predicted N-acetyltransferase YhbS